MDVVLVVDSTETPPSFAIWSLVGRLVGSFVGGLVGSLVGSFVGSFVGTLVGKLVGSFVGLSITGVHSVNLKTYILKMETKKLHSTGKQPIQ